MAVLYLVRHGHVESRGCFVGQTDVPLSPLGHEQAARLGALLSRVQFDCCFCSPLRRALETARHIVETNAFSHRMAGALPCDTALGSDLFQKASGGDDIREKEPGHEQGWIKIATELTEISLGRWEGMHKENVMETYPELWRERGKSPALVSPPDGENYPMLHDRLLPFFQRLGRLLEKRNILVVAHRSVNQVLAGKLSLFPLAHWPKISLPHGSLALCPLRASVLEEELAPRALHRR